MPLHKLKIKIRAPVLLLRNLYPDQGHYNGTRYIVKRINSHSLELEVAVGQHAGEILVLPRIKIYSQDGDFPFTFYRKQFPVKLCFAFTAKKAQGQSLNKVGIGLQRDFFTHGQLYVALSSATDQNNIHIFLKDKSKKDLINVIYQEILDLGFEINKTSDLSQFFPQDEIETIEVDKKEESEFLENLRNTSDNDEEISDS